MSTLAEKIEPLAVDVAFTADALHVVLADGREVYFPSTAPDLNQTVVVFR